MNFRDFNDDLVTVEARGVNEARGVSKKVLTISCASSTNAQMPINLTRDNALQLRVEIDAFLEATKDCGKIVLAEGEAEWRCTMTVGHQDNCVFHKNGLRIERTR